MVAPLGPRGDVSPELARDIAICFADYPDEAGQLWTHTRGELTGRLSTSTEKARRFARRCHLEANLLRSKKPPTADDIATKLEKQIGGNRKSAVEEGIKRERKSYIRKAPLRAPHDPAP
jgi:hypothetical protein